MKTLQLNFNNNFNKVLTFSRCMLDSLELAAWFIAQSSCWVWTLQADLKTHIFAKH